MNENNWQWIDEARAAEHLPRFEAHLAGLAGREEGVAQELWAQLKGKIFAPDISQRDDLPDDEPTLNMTWNHGPHHLEAGVYPSGTWEWFYMDRRDDAAMRSGYDLPADADIPAELLDLLPRFKEQKPASTASP